MRKIKYIILMTLCVLGITACQDDLIEGSSTGGVNINKPVKVELKFSVPDADEVNVSRSYENSDLGDLHLFIFDDNTFLKDEAVTKANIQGPTNSNGNEYTITADLYEGVQTVYAVGNVTTQTNYWQNPVSALQEAAEKGKESFLKTLYNVRQDVVSGGFVTFPGNYRPLAGSGDITVQANGNSSGTIQMKREVARIKLNVKMTHKVQDGSERNGNTVTFTPRTYSVYNVASKGYVLEAESGITRNAVSDGFYHVENISGFNVSDGETATIGDGFNIPENIQEPKKSGQSYADRDKWWDETKEPNAADDEKDWTYAPENGTYIVIKGNYVETDETGKVVYSAAPSYTFHLGEWNDEDDFGNFNVERNTIYTYTISVHGVKNMIVEVDKENGQENQPGAEGDVIELGEGSEVFNLDSHYEQVYVEYNLSDIANAIKNSSIGASEDEINNAIATNFMLSIHSPMNTKSGAEELVRPYTENKEEKMNGIDDGWIQFYSQDSRNSLSTYTSTARENDKYLLSPWNACKKMGEAVRALIDTEEDKPDVENLRIVEFGNDYYACFTVFVNEYFYTEDLSPTPKKVSWEKFAGAEPRTLLIASNWNASPDGNTTYATARTYISQASILTFYNPAAAQKTKALGIESYNEYGVISGFGESASDYNEKIRTDDNEVNGRANMLLDIDKLSWDNVPFTRIGYLSDNTTGRNPHRWNELEDADKKNSAYYACLSRNRDLNRNGQIDDDEVRWYLPARSQYLRMGIGANSFNTDVQLYTGDKEDMNKDSYPTSYVNDGALYYSNTPSTKGNYYDAWELYWAVEVGAYGSNHDNGYGENAQIRCVRNLPSAEVVEVDSYGDQALAEPVYGELKRLSNGNRNYIFDFDNRMATGINRTSPYDGPYLEHHESSEQNRLYKAFVVAKDYMDGTEYSNSSAASYYNNPCRRYSEDDYDSQEWWDSDDRWRTPNLNELTVMATVATEIDLRPNTMSSTTFTNERVRGLFYYNGSIISAWDPNYGEGRIRCVRDATDEEIANAVSVN